MEESQFLLISKYRTTREIAAYTTFMGCMTDQIIQTLQVTIGYSKAEFQMNFLAIADDPFGNQICIGIKKKYLGRIYFWDHEEESRFFKFKGTTLLAHTFDDFLESLYEYVDPNESEIERVVRLEDVDTLTRLINGGYDIETTDEYGRTIIENCAIHRRNLLISFLFEKGADLRSSLEFAEKNAEFFDEHKETVCLLKELGKKAAR